LGKSTKNLLFLIQNNKKGQKHEMAGLAEQMGHAVEAGAVGEGKYLPFTLANDNYGIGLLANIK
jgi:hypothetical protein